MGLLANMVQSLVPERKIAVGAAIAIGEGGNPQYPRVPGAGTYRKYALEGYSYADIVYAAIEERATSAAEPRLACYTHQAQGDPQKATDHPLLTLFEAPNPFMDRYTFLACVPMFLDIAGNCFIHKERSAGGKTVALWHLRPDRVRVIPDDARHISGYEYQLGARTWLLPAADVLHIKNRHPLDDWYGLPTMAAAAPWVDVANALSAFTQAFFRNGAVMSGLLNITKQVTEAERQLIRSRFRNEYGGAANAFNLLVLDNAEASFTAMGLPLGERGVAMPSLDEMVEAHVLRPFGVPFELVQARLGQKGVRSAVREARAGFWDETLAPLYCQIAAQLQLGFRDEPILGEGWDYLAFDLSTVQALQEDADAKHKRIREDLLAGVIAQDEARKALGYAEQVPAKAIWVLGSHVTMTDDPLGQQAAALEANPFKPPTAPDGHTSVSGHTRRLPGQLREMAAALEAGNGHANGSANGAQHG